MTISPKAYLYLPILRIYGRKSIIETYLLADRYLLMLAWDLYLLISDLYLLDLATFDLIETSLPSSNLWTDRRPRCLTEDLILTWLRPRLMPHWWTLSYTLLSSSTRELGLSYFYVGCRDGRAGDEGGCLGCRKTIPSLALAVDW